MPRPRYGHDYERANIEDQTPKGPIEHVGFILGQISGCVYLRGHTLGESARLLIFRRSSSHGGASPLSSGSMARPEATRGPPFRTARIDKFRTARCY